METDHGPARLQHHAWARLAAFPSCSSPSHHWPIVALHDPRLHCHPDTVLPGFFGASPDQFEGFLYTYSAASCPADIAASAWLAADPQAISNFVRLAVGLNITPGGCCNGVTLTGAEGLRGISARMGSYAVVEGVTRGNRQVYMHGIYTQFLYFRESSGFWQISNVLDGAGTAVYTRSTPECPEQVPETAWNVYVRSRRSQSRTRPIAPSFSFELQF